MSFQSWTELIAASVADGTAVTANGTETVIWTATTIPGNYMYVGRSLLIYSAGRFSTTTGPPTLRLRARFGGVAGVLFWDTGTITTVASQTASVWELFIFLTCRTAGSAGTVFGIGHAILGNQTAPTIGSATGAPAIALGGSAGLNTPAASASIDFTANQDLVLTATWSSASNSLTGHTLAIFSSN